MGGWNLCGSKVGGSFHDREFLQHDQCRIRELEKLVAEHEAHWKDAMPNLEVEYVRMRNFPSMERMKRVVEWARKVCKVQTPVAGI